MTGPDLQPPRSPPCFAAQADDRYMGFLDRDELVEALTTLLEAERAGARVGARLVQTASDPEALSLARKIRIDEARWCRVLASALKRLEVKPSTKVGDFYDKVMAIEGLEARLALVNRGQAWVVRQLEGLLPKIRDDRLHADLRAMLDGHAAGIESVKQALEHRPSGRRA